MTTGYYYSDILHRLYYNDVQIGESYNRFIVVAGEDGKVIKFGFDDDTEYGIKGVKINTWKLFLGKHKIYYLDSMHPPDIELMNQLKIGFDIEKKLFDRYLEKLKEWGGYADFETHFNEIVITSFQFEPCRLIGMGFDSTEYYYIYKNKNQIVKCESAVGGYTVLKGKIDSRNYSCIENNFNYKCKPEKEIKFQLYNENQMYFRCRDELPRFLLTYELFYARWFWLRRKIVSILSD